MVLKPANFKASVDGKPVVVTSATDYRGPRRLVILIDVSGSVAGTAKLSFALVFAQDLISLASPQTSIALMTFDNRIEDTVPFGRGRAALLAEIDKLQNTNWSSVKGLRRTALRDSLLSALALLKKPALGDAICVVTDGGENASHARRSRMDSLLESAGVRVYAVIAAVDPSSRGRTPEEVDGPSEMRSLASATGGAWMDYMPAQLRENDFLPGMPASVGNGDRIHLMDAARLFYGEMSTFVKLDLRLPQPLLKLRKWKLDVVDASGRKSNDVQVIYPRQLAPCNPARTP